MTHAPQNPKRGRKSALATARDSFLWIDLLRQHRRGARIVVGASPAQAVTSYFSGNGKLSITSISITGADAGEFAETNDCASSSIPVGGTCMINVTFAPTSNGSRKADLEILDISGNGPQSVALTGVGVIPVTLTPTSAKFVNRHVGTKSGQDVYFDERPKYNTQRRRCIDYGRLQCLLDDLQHDVGRKRQMRDRCRVFTERNGHTNRNSERFPIARAIARRLHN